MWVMGKARWGLLATGRALNEGVSLVVFTMLDMLDLVLCWVYKVADMLIESDLKPACYCYSSSGSREAITGSGNLILVSENKGQSAKIVRLTCSTSSKLRLEDVSDTLYSRPSLVSDLIFNNTTSSTTSTRFRSSRYLKLLLDDANAIQQSSSNHKKGGGRATTSFSVNSAIVEMLQQGKIGCTPSLPIPRWSDCDCTTCTCWTSSSKDTLFVHVHAASTSSTGTGDGDMGLREDVLFIHGFISSSKFWTETLFPNFSRWTQAKYRLFAVDLLGFGRSPKPTDSLYTLREHVEMIERSVLDNHSVNSFHIVAHSLGCILAFALAVRHPAKVKSLTLIAPPYFRVPKGEKSTQYVLRKIGPRRVWPPIAMGASIACWYEHISRTVCLVICKNHRFLEFLTKLLTRNRMRTYLMEGFFCHTHNSAWHTLHNIICGTGRKVEKYMDVVRERLKCNVTIFHGRDDELIPVECSYNVQSRIPRAQVKVFDNKDHITIVVGRQKAFATDLEAIWASSSSS